MADVVCARMAERARWSWAGVGWLGTDGRDVSVDMDPGFDIVLAAVSLGCVGTDGRGLSMFAAVAGGTCGSALVAVSASTSWRVVEVDSGSTAVSAVVCDDSVSGISKVNVRSFSSIVQPGIPCSVSATEGSM